MIRGNRHAFDIRLVCDLLDVSRQSYYDWVDRPAPPAAARRDEIVAAIRLSHVESGCRYGSPNVHRDLLDTGVACCVNAGAKLMRAHVVRSVVGRKFRVTTTDSNHDHPVSENRLDRDFAAGAPDRRWAADTTYVNTDEGFLYLAGVVDLYSRKVVGWAMRDTLHADLCVEALEMALADRRPDGPLLHLSDRGCQYAGRQ